MVMRKRVFRHMQTAQYCTFVQSNQGIHRPLHVHVTGSVDTKECINGPKARIILCACARCESLHSAPRMPVFARRSPYGHVLYYAWRRNAETCWTAAWEPAKRRPTITRASDQGNCFPFTKKQCQKWCFLPFETGRYRDNSKLERVANWFLFCGVLFLEGTWCAGKQTGCRFTKLAENLTTVSRLRNPCHLE